MRATSLTDEGGAPRGNRAHGGGRGLARQGEHQRFALDDINRAISGLQNRNGGFGNYLIVP
jgi:hypothetical protein